jgi:twinkle protein
MLDLWSTVRGLTLFEALQEAKQYLGIQEIERPKRREYKRPEKPKGVCKPKSKVLEYLTGRKLTEKSLSAYQVAEKGDWVVFPFKRDGELLQIKYLGIERPNGKKQIRVEAGCEPCLFGWQAIGDKLREIAICEGELDALSLYEYGFPALSVPFGGGKGAKHEWIETEWEYLQRFDRIYLVFDNDQEGATATQDVSERLGLHRCQVVTLPKKDANECLTSGVGQDEITKSFMTAKSLDPEELKRAGVYREEVWERFNPQAGKRPGFDLPWSKVPVRVYLGEISIWTGTKGHCKSLLLGQVMAASAAQGFNVCIASFEMSPEKTLHRMIVQRTNKAPSRYHFDEAMDWVNESTWIFDLVGTAKQERVLDVFEYAYHRYGVRQFVVDSLAKLGMAEDDYKGQKAFIDKAGDFAKRTKTHVHIVCHARKGADEYTPPGKMDVKGTGAITDMADNVFCVHRNKAKERDVYRLASNEKINYTKEDLEGQYDAFLMCAKHREDGADSEGMWGLYFDKSRQLYIEEV